jgi:hypothetical protein
MRLREEGRGGAVNGGEQSREGSWSDTANTSQSSLRMLGEASQIRIKLNRQIPELETALSLRKQRTANYSNRRSSGGRGSNISNGELTMRRASAFRAGNATRGICFALSNRELLGLEISQLIENKHRRSVLIANFEPNDFLNFKVCLATLRACVATRSFGRAGLQPRRKVHKFNRDLAPEADSFKFSRRPSRRTRFSLSPANLAEELAQQECGPR